MQTQHHLISHAIEKYLPQLVRKNTYADIFQHIASQSIRVSLSNLYLWVVLIAFTILLATLGLYPLGDTTEARYVNRET